MLMPVLVYQYGPKQAVPIMAIAAVMANLSRILAWWREVDWRACAAYSVTGIPAAALGARTLLALPSHAVDISIGLFLIAMVPARHWLARHDLKLSLWHLAVGGAVIGYITGIVVSTGPLSVPLFLFYGLSKGAFLATEAASSLGLYVSKSVTFQQFGALTPDVALKGLIAGASLMSGAFIAKRFVLKLDAGHVPAGDGRDHAGGGDFDAVECDAFAVEAALLRLGRCTQGQIDGVDGVENRMAPRERHPCLGAALGELHGPLPTREVGCLHDLVLDAPVFHRLGI